MLTEAYLEPSRTSAMEHLSSVKLYFKNVLNLIELPLSSILAQLTIS